MLLTDPSATTGFELPRNSREIANRVFAFELTVKWVLDTCFAVVGPPPNPGSATGGALGNQRPVDRECLELGEVLPKRGASRERRKWIDSAGSPHSAFQRHWGPKLPFTQSLAARSHFASFKQWFSFPHIGLQHAASALSAGVAMN